VSAFFCRWNRCKENFSIEGIFFLF
jgi:hypothetical protein